ncbi:general odorant-binding protein 45-like [Anopheles arabiensis]|uniref:general odorant-binding protein 45-like n=1 Tax=Anopheles arabiensis TaxID=7173 RepID=UPI001AAC68A5|nr:general odorant-binding protein 45-like [Anopheles arabiensis]
MATIKLKYITLACVLAATVAAGSHCHNDYYQLKSVAQAQEECARYQGIPCARLAVYNKYIYPNDSQTQCMVRCMGLNLGWWNDTHGVQESAMRSFFYPDPDDCDYERRTYHCLNSQRLNHPSPHVDVCERAYESFRCYYEHYGNIVVTPQFVPLSDLQQVDVLFQCANLLPFSVGRSCGRKASKRDVDCLARCFLLRSGLYSEQHGPHLDRLYVQCNNYANETRFRETTGTCYQRLKSECQDECVLAGRFLRECFYEGGISIVSSLPASEASVGSAGSLGSGQGSAELGESVGSGSTLGESVQSEQRSAGSREHLGMTGSLGSGEGSSQFRGSAASRESSADMEGFVPTRKPSGSLESAGTLGLVGSTETEQGPVGSRETLPLPSSLGSGEGSTELGRSVRRRKPSKSVGSVGSEESEESV